MTTFAIALLAGRGMDALVVRRGQLGRGVVIGLVFWSTCGDLWLVSRMVTNVVMVPEPAVSFREASQIRKLLLDEPTLPRLYCPGQNVGNLLGVSCLPVYLGISPQEYADPRFAGAGMPKSTGNGQLVMADEEFSKWIRAAGVTHVLSFDLLDESSWRATLIWSGMDEMLNRAWGRPEPLYLYRLGKDMDGLIPGRVWFPAQDDGIRDNETPVAVLAQEDANRIVIGTEFLGGTILVLKELGFPGWEVRIDDRSVASNVNGFRSVYVPHGEHRVVWTYRPRSVFIGTTLSLLALSVLAVLGHFRFWHREWLDRCLARVLRRR